ncbi:MAG: lamin tail domain-containing protein, partial [Flavobacteriales bacterium]|nr:lamin tail domain-containing protein [Flavobacteriales bacterium]
MRISTIFFLVAGLSFSASASAQLICDDLIISEYLEGTGNNKGLEFFNTTSEAIDLSAYELQRWSNGEAGSTDVTQLYGTLPPLTTWVLINGQTEDVDLGGGAISPACDPVMQGMADQLDNPYPAPTYMNGNDALVLVKNGTTVVDIFGKPGEDPGTAWTNDAENGFTDVGDGAAWLTSNHTLRRKYDVVHGLNVPPVVFDTFLEWDTLPVNTWDGLGSHSCACGTSGTDNLMETPSIEIFPNPSVNGQ